MTKYGLPFFLEDRTGLLTGSDFVDIHDRMSLSLRQTAKDSSHTEYMIYKATMSHPGSTLVPMIALDFGPNNSLGTIGFVSDRRQLSMKDYLSKPSVLSANTTRRFKASDGQEYQWSWSDKADQEWTCTNSSGYLIAYYSLKDPCEPEYRSSGCMLTVDEAHPHLAAEMLASLMIMRHIATYNLK